MREPAARLRRRSRLQPFAAFENVAVVAGSASVIDVRREIERVVFDATDPLERRQAADFATLLQVHLEPIHRRREELRSAITEAAAKVTQEELLHSKLAALRRTIAELTRKIERSKLYLRTLIEQGQEALVTELAKLNAACSEVESRVERLKTRQNALTSLSQEVEDIIDRSEPTRLSEMKYRFQAADLPEAAWEAFTLGFAGDVHAIIDRSTSEVNKSISVATDGDPSSPVDPTTTPLELWPLKLLQEKREATSKSIQIAKERKRRYDQTQKTIAADELQLAQVGKQLARAEGARERRDALIVERRNTYDQIFHTFEAEEGVLRHLYEPLGGEFELGRGALSRLSFVVRRRVEVDSWVSDGEALLDLRNATVFRGHGALKRQAEEQLVGPWSRGTSREVTQAMEEFRSRVHEDLHRAQPPSVTEGERPEWIQQVATWLYSTDHITIEYGVQYDGVDIELLSPGTRGIVLLLLYLAVDKTDRRPLIIDQPEENLDPMTVFDELVPHFREARKRRQIVVVTHNANLVINTDVDQVLVASSVRQPDQALPSISYEAGSLENPRIRSAVCRILEGGERAFLERARRYRLRWAT